ncbi:NAD(P)-binding protein [Epithele typhae]|uniref:NAD(P)-binding protein n=1 Tax=Epithele typhae TaxID=378194 RepID=UPI00200881A8|nr:NAD(P)-binding protein [Epithele typhae]KAH9940780.1 NAD(P)-binding protein [Epithele typhae]
MGNAWSDFSYNLHGILQAFPPKSQFSIDQIPDLTGRVVIVTGGNVGIGHETCKALLMHNAKVYLAARSKEKALNAITLLKEQTGKETIFLELDLSDLHSVKTAAEEFLSKEHELHILFNNAGVMWAPLDLLTKQGYDLQFGTNAIGHFAFTEFLMPALLAGVVSSPDHHTRIVTTSSSAGYVGKIDFDAIRDGPARRKLSTSQLYFNSKLANGIVANQTAKRYADKGIISVSLNPGNFVRTELGRYASPFLLFFLDKIVVPASTGALTQLYAGTMPEALNHNGAYFIPWARVGRFREEAYDDILGEKMWKYLEGEVKKHTS